MGERRLRIAGRGAPSAGPVRLTVRDGGEDILIYNFASVGEAAELHAFIREFFPRADFILEPLLH